MDLARWIAAVMQAAPEAGDAAASTIDDDARNMRRLAAGDTHALRPLFDRWKLPLLSYFYRALGSRADAEDLALQVFERVYRAADRFREDARFSTWLFAIARGELLHELRRRRRKPVEPVAPEDLEAISGSGETGRVHAREIEEQLLIALQSLSERERSAVLLVSAGDLSRDEIARTLGVSINHLNVLLHRGRQALRELFKNSL